MKKISLNHQNGFTLIEIALVFGVIALLGTGIFVNYDKRRASVLADNQSKYIETINRTIVDGYGVVGDFSALTPENLINQGIAPKEMINGSSLSNVWGGDFKTGAATFGGLPGFFITLTQVPASGCAKVASTIANDFLEMDINGVAVKTSANADVLIDVAEAVNNCAPNFNTITLRNRQVIGADPFLPPTPPPPIPPIPVASYPGMIQTPIVQPYSTTCVNGQVGAGPLGGTCGTCPGGGTWNGSFCVVCNVSPSYNGTTLPHEYVYDAGLQRCI